MSLDIPERQILLYFADDAVPWHHRILLERIGGARWVVATPTLDVEVTDLDQAEDLRPLGRSDPFPEACRPVFAFEELSGAEILGLRAEAGRLADILGVFREVDQDGTEAVWVYADPSHEKFGETVSAEAMAGGRSLLRGAAGLLEEAGGDGAWVFVERVSPDDKVRWMSAKRAGAGRDPRLNEAAGADREGRLLLSVALGTMRKADTPHWPYKGPSAVLEVLTSIRATGMEPPAYLVHYLQSSGLAPQSGLANEVRVLLTQLWFMVCFDKLDVTNLASAELLARRLLQVQRAVKRNPRAPDFSGLEAFTQNALDPAGNLLTTDFDRYMMEVQKTEAAIMKNQRMAFEETEAVRKKEGGKGGRGGGSAASSSTA